MSYNSVTQLNLQNNSTH